MSKYRNQLPQLSGETFLTDGGIETTLIFKNGIDLPEFAAFNLFKQKEGYQTLRDYYLPYIQLAKENTAGFILESPTWRASRDWGRKLGYRQKDLKEINTAAIGLLRDIRNRFETKESKMVISGCIGPRGDGYSVAEKMSTREAQQYHAGQIETFSHTDADMVTALTMNYVEEAIGITRAAVAAGLPVAIGFTVETDGRLPSGQSLGDAIEQVDRETAHEPAYYLINCAHPSHFAEIFHGDEPWNKRIRGIRANASDKSHAELDEATELDAGDPQDLGQRYADLKCHAPQLNIFGGCCGTDHQHITEMFKGVDPNNPSMDWDACWSRSLGNH